MRQSEFTLAGRQGLLHADVGLAGTQAVAQQLVFAHRKPVPFGQRQDELIGVEGLHGAIVTVPP